MRQPAAPRVLTELCALPVEMITATLLEEDAPTVMLAEGLNVHVAFVGTGYDAEPHCRLIVEPTV